MLYQKFNGMYALNFQKALQFFPKIYKTQENTSLLTDIIVYYPISSLKSGRIRIYTRIQDSFSAFSEF